MRHLQYPTKCAWAKHDELSEKYHDEEWGVPVHDERKHFMYLIMETMSCGLSWQMMLQRREVFSQCFANFDASKVAEFTTDDVDRIMQTEGMIRSRSKIEAMIDNAKAFMKVAKRFGSFDRYVWSFTQGRSLIYPSHQREVPKSNDLSDKVAKDMKKRGFNFIGSVIIYSFLQAIGIINDHESTCWRYDILSRDCTIVDDRSPVM
nr:DNA-3-methyladenine glycosylase I [Prevotella sp. S7-1-8]